jgi:peroxiredoxin
VRPVAISVDKPEESRDLSRKAKYTFPLLSDPNAEVIARYGIVHKGAGVNGHDVARPAEFLVDATGKIRWVNFTEDYRVRARPEQLVAAAKGLR